MTFWAARVAAKAKVKRIGFMVHQGFRL
jgi:hypothetical protein